MEATLKEAIEAVEFRCRQRLGHLGRVVTNTRDFDWRLGVGLMLPDKRRHAVDGDSDDAIADPVAFADWASDELLKWHAKL